jgi:hypothetical protein
MSLNNSPCPSAEILRQSLDPDDPMTEQERQRIEAHVDHCEKSCKEVIETLLRGNTLPLTPSGTKPLLRTGRPRRGGTARRRHPGERRAGAADAAPEAVRL